ncbi:MAG: 3-methyl-2-oxobutanoate hydroxymethyltransferase [Actinomycetota bacterium]|nr:3-methyl-2-oxobutanoate hydroxymethyltransferase [Actinomycetota bacterium]
MAIDRITTVKLKEMKAAGAKIVGATAWDFVSAGNAESAGVDIVLVGDSLAMTMRGDPDTLAITLEDMIYHSKMVSRACKVSMVIGDMPFMSYQISPEQALTSAGRFLKEGGVRGVKIEGGRKLAASISKTTDAGIPVMGHIGLTPQSIHQIGGFKVQARTLDPAIDLIEDARCLQEAGAFAIVLECVPAPLSAHITSLLEIPTIGIGAGNACDGQIQVTADVIGLTGANPPKHAKRYADLNSAWTDALREYVKEVREGAFPTDDQSFSAGPDLQKAIDDKEL